jgi:hypothetical protein
MRYMVGMAVVLLVVAILGPARADAQVVGGQISHKSRIYILDASGSMSARNYNGGNQSRLNRAKELLMDEIRQLKELNDKTPTYIYAFGSKTKWSDVQGKYNDLPEKYPAHGDLCKDITLEASYTKIGANEERDLRATLRRIEFGGMTPIHIALKRALEKVDAMGAEKSL